MASSNAAGRHRAGDHGAAAQQRAAVEQAVAGDRLERCSRNAMFSNAHVGPSLVNRVLLRRCCFRMPRFRRA